MNQKRILIVVLVVVTTAIAVFVWSRPGELRCQGQPLIYWVDALWNSGFNQEEAKAAIRTADIAKAVPFLLEKVRRAQVKQQKVAAWSQLPAAVRDYVPEPELDYHLLHNKIPYALSLMGAPVIPALKEALRDTNPDVQTVAARALAMMGAAAEATLPDVISLLQHTNGEVRLSAVFAVEQTGGKRTEAIQALISALRDNNRGPSGTVFVKESALAALGRIGPEAKAAVPAITGLLDAPDVYTRREAVRALWRIEHDPNLVERAVQELETPRQGIHNYKAFLDVLGEMGPAARSSVPSILRTATNWGTDMSKTIRPVLVKIDPEAAEALGNPPR